MDFFQNLRTFLNEVCVFLDKEILKSGHNDDVKSRATKLIANAMIMRDKSIIYMADTDGYIDMMKAAKDEYVGPDVKPVYASEVDYSTADYDPAEAAPAATAPAPATVEKMECPYQNALLGELQPIKDGALVRKEYVFHYLPVNRAYFVVLLDEWLLFFNASRKHRALEAYSLQGITAKNPDDKGGTFTLDVDDKSFTLTADTRKEKLQWISAISNINNFKTFEGSARAPSVGDRCEMYHAATSAAAAEYVNGGSGSQPPTLPLRTDPLPPLPGPSEIYQYLPPPKTLPPALEDYQLLPTAAPEEDYQLLPAPRSEPDLYEDVDPAPAAADYPDDIYESIPECRENNNERPPPAQPPKVPEKPAKVPAPPKETTMLQELRLRQKLYQQSKGQVGAVERAQEEVQEHVEGGDRRKKTRLSFNIGSRRK